MRRSVPVGGLCVVVMVGGMLGCAKPGPVRTKATTVTSQDEVNNPGIVADRVNEEARKSGNAK